MGCGSKSHRADVADGCARQGVYRRPAGARLFLPEPDLVQTLVAASLPRVIGFLRRRADNQRR